MPTIEPFADVDVTELAARLTAIPVSLWPRLIDPTKFGWAEIAAPLVDHLMVWNFTNCLCGGVGLFVLDPGQRHTPHTDVQPPEWVTRVHVPVVSNPLATATTDEGTIHMLVGKAYRFNTRALHAVYNGGKTPRVHLVFDVKRR